MTGGNGDRAASIRPQLRPTGGTLHATTMQSFDKVQQRLEFGDTEKKDAARRQTEVRECIRSGFESRGIFLLGVYKRHTKTKPLKDVDLMFVLGPKEKGTPGINLFWRRQAFERLSEEAVQRS